MVFLKQERNNAMMVIIMREMVVPLNVKKKNVETVGLISIKIVMTEIPLIPIHALIV